MMAWPGPRPIRCDTVELSTDPWLRITGDIVLQGVTHNGCGYTEITLPDADPQQRRVIERTSEYSCWFYRDDQLLFVAHSQHVHRTHRSPDGSLVVTGAAFKPGDFDGRGRLPATPDTAHRPDVG